MNPRYFFRAPIKIAAVLLVLWSYGGLPDSAHGSISSVPFGSPLSEWSDIGVPTVKSMKYAISGDVGTFTLSGKAGSLDVGPGFGADFAPFIAPTTISDLKFNAITGEVLSPGQLVIFLTMPLALPNPPYTANTNLLTATIFDAAFDAPGVIQMLFKVTGGTAAPLFGGYNSIGALNINIIPGDLASKPTSFKSGFTYEVASGVTGVTMDVFGEVVPEPTSFLVFGALMLMGLAFTSRRQ
jgi:hypothetical protein